MYGTEIVGRRKFAGRMSSHSQFKFIGRNSLPIIDDRDSIETTAFDLDPNPGGTSIDAVLDQFLDHLSGTFDHFTSGDVADGVIIQLLDGATILCRDSHVTPPTTRAFPAAFHAIRR